MRPRLALALSIWAVCLLPLTAACGGNNSGSSPDATPAVPDANHQIDAATMCPPGTPPVCDLFLGCGCDLTMGQKCSIFNTGHACVAAGTKVTGDACTTDADCASGTLCSDSDHICLKFCDNVHHCAAGDACYIGVSGTTDLVCGKECSLLGQDCPLTADACYPASAFVNEKEKGICVPAGTHVQGDACQRSSDCAKGFVCLNGAPGFCAKMCDHTLTTGACAGTLKCGAIANETMTGACHP